MKVDTNLMRWVKGSPIILLNGVEQEDALIADDEAGYVVVADTTISSLSGGKILRPVIFEKNQQILTYADCVCKVLTGKVEIILTPEQRKVALDIEAHDREMKEYNARIDAEAAEELRSKVPAGNS